MPHTKPRVRGRRPFTTWLERLRIAIDRNKEPDDWYFHYLYMGQRDPDLHNFVSHFALSRGCESAHGAEVNLINDQFFVKEEVSEERTEWYNDQPFWPVRGPAMSIWLAVDEVSEDTGATEFMRGSHLWGRWFEITGPNLPWRLVRDSSRYPTTRQHV